MACAFDLFYGNKNVLREAICILIPPSFLGPVEL